MRDANAPEDARAPGLEPGGWLHLDVSAGCAGDMLSAALLDLGLPEEALRRGLHDAGLYAVGPRVRRDRRGPVAGLHLTFADGTGRPVDAPEESPRLRVPPASTRGRREPEPHLHAPKDEDEDDKRAGLALDEESARAEPGAAAGRDEERGEERTKLGGEVLSGPTGETRIPARDPIEEWLSGTRASGPALLSHLRQSRLSPLAKALATKALRRALEALARVKGEDLDDLSLPGRHAVDLLADVVSFAALLEALSPARVTASPVAISCAPVRIDGTEVPGPSPWVLAILEGVRVHEREADLETTTPTGAALVWSVAHRYGPRGDLVIGRAGCGLGTKNPRAFANVCRALYGPAPSPATDRQAGALAWLSALLGDDEDTAGLEIELSRLGASSLSFESRLGPSGRPVRAASLLVPAAHVDAAVRALYALGGAAEVAVVPAERRAAAVTAVTVRIGHGNKRPAVRVLERREAGLAAGGSEAGGSEAGALLSAEPHAGDLREAARALGLGPGAARAEVLAAWSRLTGGQTASGDEPPGEGE